MLLTFLMAGVSFSPAASAADALASNPFIPAAAVAIIQCDSADIGIAGAHVEGEPGRVDNSSRFNIGSNAKSMLATLAAIEVERGRLNWSDTVGGSAAFADVENHPDLNDATLAELLSHTSGVAAFASGDALNTVSVEGDAATQRTQFAAQALSTAPEGPRGAYLYSNAGYVIAAEMIGAALGEDPMQAMASRLFAPLHLEAHLGEPSAIGEGQPRGHTASNTGPAPLAPDQDAIPDFLDPAGDISITPQSYGQYLQMHLCGLEGEDAFLSADAIAHLHQAREGTDYALGWAKTDLPAGRASFHIGGTGAFTTIAALIPEAGVGVAVMMNTGGSDAQSAGVATVLELLAPGQ